MVLFLLCNNSPFRFKMKKGNVSVLFCLFFQKKILALKSSPFVPCKNAAFSDVSRRIIHLILEGRHNSNCFPPSFLSFVFFFFLCFHFLFSLILIFFHSFWCYFPFFLFLLIFPSSIFSFFPFFSFPFFSFLYFSSFFFNTHVLSFFPILFFILLLFLVS